MKCDARPNVVSELHDKPLPSNHEAERGLLRALIIEPVIVDREHITAEHFNHEHYRLVFLAIALLRENNLPIDVAQVARQLKADGHLDEIGGSGELAELLSDGQTRAQANEYIQAAADCFARRQLYFAATGIIQAVYRNQPATEILATARRKIEAAAEDAGERDSTIQARVRAVDTIEATDLEWFWLDRIPMGKFSLVSGDGGDGKSVMMLDLAARTTTGALLPCSTARAPLGRVLLIVCEDDASDTIRPRLEAAGADLSKVDVLDVIEYLDPATGEMRERLPVLATDMHLIEAAIVRGGHKLVIVDTVTGFMGKIDNNSQTDVRNGLMPLVLLAGKHHCAIVGIAHFTKDDSKAARYRTSGSVAYIALARSALAVGRSPDDNDLRLVAGVKTNLGRSPETLGFRIRATNEVPYLEWLAEPVDTTADEMLAPPKPKASATTTWLEQYLGDGPRLSKDVIDEGRKAGHSYKMLRSASEDLGVIKSKIGVTGGWQWELPANLPYRPGTQNRATSGNFEKNTGQLGDPSVDTIIVGDFEDAPTCPFENTKMPN